MSNRPEPKRDRWGRYLVDGEGYQRATTFAKMVADTTGLSKWQQRMVALGLAQRPDLLALAASAAEDKRRLDGVCKDALDAAAAGAGANTGTALHSFSEQVDMGLPVAIPAPWDADIAAYSAALTEAGVTMELEHIEQVVILDTLKVAGTFDRVVTVDGRRYVADLKTGRDLSYSWGEIAVQLALYANADAILDTETGERRPMPEVDRERALVIHLPAGTATCTLHWVDISAGWEMVETIARVRSWRKRKDLATPFASAAPRLHIVGGGDDAVEPTPQAPHLTPADPLDREVWLRGRLGIIAAHPEARVTLAELWGASGLPKLKGLDRALTAEEIDGLAEMAQRVEARHQLPFGEPDPAELVAEAEAADVAKATKAAKDAEVDQWQDRMTTEAPDEGPVMDDETREALKRALGKLPMAVRSRVQQWAAQARGAAKTYGPQRNISTKDIATERRFEIARAMKACAEHLAEDDDVRDALGMVLDLDVQPAHRIGHAFTLLTIQQARNLVTVAEAIGRGDSVAFDADGAPVIRPAA